MDVYVRSIGGYVPPQIVSNDDIASRTGGTAEWIAEHTGIVTRHHVDVGTSNSMLAEQASREALREAGLSTDDIQSIVFATLSPDAGFPGSGVFLQRRLDAWGIPALDVRNQCSGFLYGLSVAKAWLSSGQYKNTLLVGSEVQSTGLDYSYRGRTVAALFGDGAGAVVLDTESKFGGRVIDVRIGADGRGIENLWCELPASGLHPNIDASYLTHGRQYPQMQGRTMFRRAVETLEREVSQLLSAHALAASDVLFVPHQANKFLNEMLAKRLGIPLEKVVSTIEEFGNTTAASIPLGLRRASLDGRLKGPVVIAAFGSGYTWGTALLEWPA